MMWRILCGGLLKRLVKCDPGRVATIKAEEIKCLFDEFMEVAMEFIELSQVEIASGGVIQSVPNVLVRTSNIVRVSGGQEDTSIISLVDGAKLCVSEPYSEVKAKLGLTEPAH